MNKTAEIHDAIATMVNRFRENASAMSKQAARTPPKHVVRQIPGIRRINSLIRKGTMPPARVATGDFSNYGPLPLSPEGIKTMLRIRKGEILKDMLSKRIASIGEQIEAVTPLSPEAAGLSATSSRLYRHKTTVENIINELRRSPTVTLGGIGERPFNSHAFYNIREYFKL